jgi:hypothetical protein
MDGIIMNESTMSNFNDRPFRTHSCQSGTVSRLTEHSPRRGSVDVRPQAVLKHSIGPDVLRGNSSKGRKMQYRPFGNWIWNIGGKNKTKETSN